MPNVGLFKLDNETLFFIKEGNFLKLPAFKVSELTCFSQSVC